MGKWMHRRSVIGMGFLTLTACGAATTTPTGPKPPVTESPKQNDAAEATTDKKRAMEPGGGAVAPIEKAEDALPTKVTSVFQFVGKDSSVIINIPRLEKVISAVDPEIRESITKSFLDEMKQKSPVEAAVAKSLIDSFESAVIFSDPDKKNGGEKATEEAACVAAKFKNPGPVEIVLSGKDVERNGPRFTATNSKDKNKPGMHGVWFADSGYLIGCVNAQNLSRSLAVATGALPSYATSPRFVAERANDVFVSVDMHPILGDKVEPGSDLFASLTTPGQSLGLDIRLNLYGSAYPPVGSVLAPSAQSLVGKMPKGTLGALGLSLKRAPGKDLASVISLIDNATNGHKLQEIKDGAAKIGIEFSDIDAALGDELAIGIYRNAKEKLDFEKDAGFKHTAGILAIATNDEAAHKKIWTTLTGMVKKKGSKEAIVSGDSIESVEKPKSKKNDFARVELRKGFIVFAMGDKAMVKEALAKFGKDTLASVPAFQEARAKEKPAMHLLTFVDGATLKSLIADKGGKPKTPAAAGGPAFLSLLLGPTDRGIELSLGGGGAMDLISTGSTLAINGFNSYMANTKTSEARSNVRFMASYARNAYDLELGDGPVPTHRLCKSSTPVPATIPKGTTYKTTMGSGGDWDTGDDNTGWKCLRFFSNEEIRYQYEYRQGGEYKGPKRGGPNPGPNGFEVSAEGDLDGDGKTSLFTRTGKIVGNKVVLDEEIFSSDPTE